MQTNQRQPSQGQLHHYQAPHQPQQPTVGYKNPPPYPGNNSPSANPPALPPRSRSGSTEFVLSDSEGSVTMGNGPASLRHVQSPGLPSSPEQVYVHHAQDFNSPSNLQQASMKLYASPVDRGQSSPMATGSNSSTGHSPGTNIPGRLPISSLVQNKAGTGSPGNKHPANMSQSQTMSPLNTGYMQYVSQSRFQPMNQPVNNNLHHASSVESIQSLQSFHSFPGVPAGPPPQSPPGQLPNRAPSSSSKEWYQSDSEASIYASGEEMMQYQKNMEARNRQQQMQQQFQNVKNQMAGGYGRQQVAMANTGGFNDISQDDTWYRTTTDDEAETPPTVNQTKQAGVIVAQNGQYPQPRHQQPVILPQQQGIVYSSHQQGVSNRFQQAPTAMQQQRPVPQVPYTLQQQPSNNMALQTVNPSQQPAQHLSQGPQFNTQVNHQQQLNTAINHNQPQINTQVNHQPQNHLSLPHQPVISPNQPNQLTSPNRPGLQQQPRRMPALAHVAYSHPVRSGNSQGFMMASSRPVSQFATPINNEAVNRPMTHFRTPVNNVNSNKSNVTNGHYTALQSVRPPQPQYATSIQGATINHNVSNNNSGQLYSASSNSIGAWNVGGNLHYQTFATTAQPQGGINNNANNNTQGLTNGQIHRQSHQPPPPILPPKSVNKTPNQFEQHQPRYSMTSSNSVVVTSPPLQPPQHSMMSSSSVVVASTPQYSMTSSSSVMVTSPPQYSMTSSSTVMVTSASNVVISSPSMRGEGTVEDVTVTDPDAKWLPPKAQQRAEHQARMGFLFRDMNLKASEC